MQSIACIRLATVELIAGELLRRATGKVELANFGLTLNSAQAASLVFGAAVAVGSPGRPLD